LLEGRQAGPHVGEVGRAVGRQVEVVAAEQLEATCASSWRMLWLMALAVMHSLSAARPEWRSRATASKGSRDWLGGMRRNTPSV
jgi:hypothetical protein